ncbi:unnamed protein product [Gongylonema pulchrum]|uniref:CRAL-TRIO domain-containing protein n=1 Tax=Gongylonema pulchrum TaxID=637853 RepID=A0A183EFL8_9BILA|nr:unnamed protein product [Gongylonema pulchrum]
MARRRSRALVVRSAARSKITRSPTSPFMFPKFTVTLPATMIARVTEYLQCDTYCMRKPEVLDDLQKHIVATKMRLTPRASFSGGVCCIAHLIRPIRANEASFQPQLFRAMATSYDAQDKTCDVLLLDFGQRVTCSVSDLFELTEQVKFTLETCAPQFPIFIIFHHRSFLLILPTSWVNYLTHTLKIAKN